MVDDEEQSEESTGPRVPSFGVMTSTEIIEQKKVIKKKKREEEILKQEKAEARTEERNELARRAKAKRDELMSLLDMEKPLREKLRSFGLVSEEEFEEISKKTLSKALLMDLAAHVGLRVTNSDKRPTILRLLLDDGET